jgi:hypothetical protein
MRHAYIKRMLLWGFEKSLPISLGTGAMDGANETLCVCVCVHVILYIYIFVCYVWTYTHKYIMDPSLWEKGTNMITAV